MINWVWVIDLPEFEEVMELVPDVLDIRDYVTGAWEVIEVLYWLWQIHLAD